MFGSRTKELSALLTSTKLDLEKVTEEKKNLEKELSAAKGKLRKLEKEIGDSSVKELEEKMKATIAEFEGLKELYNRKIKTFEDSRIEKEQSFARESALARFNLETEITNNRQANQDFVAETVNTFSETYNYYLNQIKVLMDALSQVAQQAGRNLFKGDTENLKANFGLQLADALKSGTDKLTGDEGELIVIGASEEELEIRQMETEEAEAAKEAAKEAAEKTEEAEAAEEAEADGAPEEAKELAEEVAEDLEKAADETEAVRTE